MVQYGGSVPRVVPPNVLFHTTPERVRNRTPRWNLCTAPNPL